jgi:hypothetical protein
MGVSERAIAKIIENRNRKINGGFNSIPFGLKRLEQYVPGVQKPNYVIITANSGIGKTKVAKNMFVFRPYDFLKRNPASGIKFDILYFCLEEPEEAWMQSYISYKLWKQYKQRISIKELRSQLNPGDPTAVIDEVTVDRVNAMLPDLKEFEKTVHIIRGVDKPYSIYKYVTDFVEDHSIGDWVMGPKRVWSPADSAMVTKIQKERFTYVHPDHYVLVIIDHISLIQPEKGQDLWEAIRVLSSRYLVNLRNIYGCSILVLQQQSSEKEKQQFTYKGASIESKLEPSLDGLGNCKETQRDADEVYGIFAPDRYEITDHRGYDISLLRDNYRSFSILKSRDGEANLRLGLFFDGATNYIAELVPAREMTKAHYDTVLKLTGRA